mgnify:CR=1 FL=1
MLTPTHLVAGQTSFLLATVIAGHQPTLPEALLAAAASVIPDLDSKQSYIGRMLPFISGPMESYFGHRTLSHSLLAQAVIGLLAYTFLPFGYFLALIAGWLSHSLADMMTPAGVCWFWPSRIRCVLPGNARYRMESMGKGELWFLLVMAVSAIPLLSFAQTGKGTTGLIRSAIGNITTAREDYDAQKGFHVWSLDVEGRNNQTYEDVAGSYPVIGPYRESGFIIGTPDGPRSLCRNSACDWYSDHASLVKGGLQQTTTTTVQTHRIKADLLHASLVPLHASGTVYLLGELSATGVAAMPPTVEVSSESVHLRYASPEIFSSWGKKYLDGVNLIVQIRHDPDIHVAKIEAIAPVSEIGLDPLLQKWVDTYAE